MMLQGCSIIAGLFAHGRAIPCKKLKRGNRSREESENEGIDSQPIYPHMCDVCVSLEITTVYLTEGGTPNFRKKRGPHRIFLFVHLPNRGARTLRTLK